MHLHAPPCNPPCTSVHLHAPLHTPLRTSMHPSVHLRTPLSAPLRTPLHTPPCTSAHDSDWLIVPITTNHIPAFKNLINIKSWFFPHHLFEKPLRTSAHLCAPLRTSAHDSDWSIVPTTTNHIPAFKNLINIKSRFFSPPPLWKTSMHLCWPPHTPPCTSAHLRAWF